MAILGLKKISACDSGASGQKFENLIIRTFLICPKITFAKFQPFRPKNAGPNLFYFILRYGRFTVKWSKNDLKHNFLDENYISWVPHLLFFIKQSLTQLLGKFQPLNAKNRAFMALKQPKKGHFQARKGHFSRRVSSNISKSTWNFWTKPKRANSGEKVL